MADAYLDMKTITGLSGSDYNMNMQRPGSFAPGQVVFLHAATGLVVLVLVQNRSTSDIDQGNLVAKLGSVAVNNITPGSDPRTDFSLAGLTGVTSNYHIGSIAYVTGQGTPAPVGEYGIVVANTATAFVLDADRPLSADLTGTSDFDLHPVYQCVINDTDNVVTQNLLGITIGVDGIDDQNFGFVQCFGICPVVKRSADLTAGGQFVSSDAGAGGSVEAQAANDNTDIIVGKAISDGPDSDSDFFVGQIAVGPMATVFGNANTQ